jgi:hypothetical protein
MIAERPDSIECLVGTDITDEMRLRRRCGLYDLSVRSFEGLAGAPVSAFADIPLCCALVPAPDDQSKALGVNLWAVEASDDTEADRAWGECLADDAMRYDRENPGADILSGILYWMGAALHFEGRCAGPLENGFVYRVLRDCPDAVDRMFAAVYRQQAKLN